MAEKPETFSRTSEFGGLARHVSPHKLPLGKAQVATNVRCQTAGQLDVRKGLKPVTFANATTATTNSILAMTHYPRAEGDYVVYEDSAGGLHVGLNPT